MSQPSFWDADDLTEPIRVRDTVVGPASPSDVAEFCCRYHYTSHSGADMWRWGLWHGVTLLGVVSYNNGSKSSTAAVFGEDYKEHVWHMGRLALADVAPHNSESRLIAGSLRAIEREYPSVWAVLTFAATDVGHVGYVYQATNALYTGTGGAPTFYVTPEGVRMTHRPGHGTISRADAESRGWTRYVAPQKHRYVYLLGNRRERRERLALLRYPVLPYPKGGSR